jgi:hypothetical protein
VYTVRQYSRGSLSALCPTAAAPLHQSAPNHGICYLLPRNFRFAMFSHRPVARCELCFLRGWWHLDCCFTSACGEWLLLLPGSAHRAAIAVWLPDKRSCSMVYFERNWLSNRYTSCFSSHCAILDPCNAPIQGKLRVSGPFQ